MWKLGLLCCLVALLAGAYGQTGGLLVSILDRQFNGRPVGQALISNGQLTFNMNVN